MGHGNQGGSGLGLTAYFDLSEKKAGPVWRRSVGPATEHQAFGRRDRVGKSIAFVGKTLQLRGPREALARKIELRASRAVERFEESRSKEDVD